MAYTIAVSGTDTIDLTTTSKTPQQYRVIYNEKFENTETCEKVIVVDPRRDTVLQITGNGTDTYDLWVTAHAGEGNTDIMAAGVPWVQLEDDATADYLSGGAAINKGILAIRILSSTLTGDFEVFVAEMPDNE